MSDHHDLVAHMRRVQRAERDLRDLGLVWRMIESSAAISCPEEVAPLLPTLAHTRGRFDALQGRLVGALAEASRQQVGDELAAKAQCAIDILVRNLYERTADVGFLATDDSLRDFCAASPAERDETRAAVVERLAAYQATYTVYDDLVLLAPDGAVLARLDMRSAVTGVDEPWLQEARARDGWTERHGPSALSAGDGPALLYAHRIVDAAGRCLGLLVLRFRLADELERIFARMADDRGQIALVLVDGAERVVASCDPAHVPVGAALRPIPAGEVSVTTFAGREYLAVQCPTRGYQGYRGPGWRARAMVSLLTAFATAEDDAARDDAVPLDDGALRVLQDDADGINRELRRVVWNGQLMARRQQGDSIRLKAVLGEVDRAGQRTRERVSQAVRDLHRASLRRARTHATQLAVLAADILDRNLYERANDCRWWALSPALRTLMAAPADDGNAARIGSLLDHVNALYTVYSRLVVFDVSGRIRGLSRAGGCAVAAGATVPAAWVEAVGRLSDPGQHAVTPFEDTALHDAGATFTYLAAVTTPGGGARLGGIAIVFNARDELSAMLRDVIGERPGVAAFVAPDGRVLAATDAGLSSATVRRIPEGDSLVEHDGAHHACTRRVGSGYREHRTVGVEVLVALRLGPVERRQGTADRSLVPQTVAGRTERLELAVFQVGAGRYALPAAAVLEALPRDAIVKAPGGPGGSLGLLEVAGPGGSRLVRVVCARTVFGVTYPARASDGVVVVLAMPGRPDQPALGLRVDEVLGITEVPRSAWRPSPVGGGGSRRVTGLVDCPVTSGSDAPGSVERALVQLVDPTGLLPSDLPVGADDALAISA